MTFDPSDLDLSKNETLKDTSGVNLDPPTKFHEDRTKDLGGEEEQTNKRCSNYSMMINVQANSVTQIESNSDLLWNVLKIKMPYLNPYPAYKV